MKDKFLQEKHIFYKEFRTTNTSLVLGLIIISFGTYLIHWFYKRTQEFNYVEKDAPEAQRAAAVLAIVPLGWLIIIRIIKKLIFTGVVGEIIEIVGWGLIIFMVLKFLHDFCVSFGKITGTKGIYWFAILTIGIVGIICTIFKIYILSILVLFIVLTIPAMQSELNSHFNRMTIKKNSNIFYN